MMQEVIERQGGYYHLDAPARTLSGRAHRAAYGSDGDYWSKPSAETVFERGHAGTSDSEREIKELHAKIGRLAMENDFLAGALGRVKYASAAK